MSEAASVRARNLRTVAALAALFFVPLALAFCAYYGSDWRPMGHVNHGSLITPPRPLPALSVPLARSKVAISGVAPAAPGTDGSSTREAFRDTWTLVAIGDGACDADCGRALLVMRQAHLALGRDMSRVARLYIATGPCCAGELSQPGDPGVLLLLATAPRVTEALGHFPTENRARSVFVVDPLGNLMMSYDSRADPRGLLIDLQRLLRLSHIG